MSLFGGLFSNSSAEPGAEETSAPVETAAPAAPPVPSIDPILTERVEPEEPPIAPLSLSPTTAEAVHAAREAVAAAKGDKTTVLTVNATSVVPTPATPSSNRSPVASALAAGLQKDVKHMPAQPPPSPVVPAAVPPSTDPIMAEVDYDLNATALYKHIEGRRWDDAMKFIEDNTDNGRAERAAATWVIRKEKNGKLRWRLLPIHGCIMFGGPLPVVEALLEIFAYGAQCKDDQGMLPLHLAFRNDAPDEILTELLSSYPQAIVTKDRKGRVPLACALLSTTTTKKSRGKMLQAYSSLSAAIEKDAATKEADATLRSRVEEIQTRQAEDVDRVKKSFESSLVNNIEKINAIEAENADLKAENEGLNERLDEKAQSEAELTEKVRDLTKALEAMTQMKRNESQRYEAELASFVKTRGELIAQLGEVEKDKLSVEEEVTKMSAERTQDAIQKDVLKSSLDDLISSHRTIMGERDELQKRNDVLCALLERMAADQEGMHACLSKLEQDMNAAAVVRERMMSALAKQESDSSALAEREHDVMRGMLDRQSAEIDDALANWGSPAGEEEVDEGYSYQYSNVDRPGNRVVQGNGPAGTPRDIYIQQGGQ